MKKKVILSLLIFVIAAIYITFPLVFHIGDYTTGYGDELLLAWIHSWVVHALITNPSMLFNANIYYPYPNTLAYSDLFITGSLLTAPFVYLFGQPIAANNITLIYSLIMDGFSLYLLAFYLTKNFVVSLIAGLLVIFSPATLSNAVQLQMLEIYWVPLAILFFLLFLNRNKTRFFILFLVCFLLQFYNSFFPAYFIFFSAVIIFLFKWIELKKKITKFFTRKTIVSLVVTFLLLLPLVVPYFQVSREFHYVRNWKDAIHFALQPEDFLYPGANTRLGTMLLHYIPTNHYSQNNEFKPGYLGFVFSLLSFIVVIYIIKNLKKLSVNEKIFITIAFVGLILSFGPFLHLNRQTIHHPFPIPLPYLLFYYIMPGFQGFRNSQRWEMLFIIGIAMVISLILNKFIKYLSLKMQIVLYGLLIIGIMVEFLPFTFVTVPQKKDFPKIYSWMKTTPYTSSFIFMPIYNWNMQPFVEQELFREYFSTIEYRPMVNGYSGFSPPPWQNFIYSMHKSFPQMNALTTIKTMHVKYIIIDKNSYDTEYKAHAEKYDGNKIIATLKKNSSVSFVKDINNYAIFLICYKNKSCLSGE